MALPLLFRHVRLLAGLAGAVAVWGQGPKNVLLVVNDNSPVSRSIGEYYRLKRDIPPANVCRIRSSTAEEIPRDEYDQRVNLPIRRCLVKNSLVESIFYIVTTKDVPLRIAGTDGLNGTIAAVDSELALLYTDIKTNKPHALPGIVPNPFFGKVNAKFSHSEFPIYLVTRLAAYDFPEVRDLINRSLQAKNRGKFVIDAKRGFGEEGDDWLLDAARRLPPDRVVIDQSTAVLYEQTDVIGYAAWGSNDKSRHRRFLGFHWLPGAIMTEFVSTNGRTFQRPPDGWNISSDWLDPSKWFAGAPQSLITDYIQEGASGAAGNVYEPYLGFTSRPDLLLPAYFSGRNLAESYYLSLPGLSWQGVIVGDPLCSLGKP
jgi:uncharacterized protein (TIGR03790 family)